ncbi:MAG: type III glutamate--ammonia ligase, partial [Methyloceanibacter sp.]
MDEQAPANAAKLEQVLAAKGVKYLMASFSDMHGVSKTKMVPLDHIGQMLVGSELYTGAALDGVPQDVSDEEVSAHPDPSSCTILPWQRDVAWFASDLWCEGAPFEPCSRNILKRQVSAAEELGFLMQFGMEAEFFVFKDTENGGYEPLSTLPHLDKPAYDATRLLDNLPWLADLIDAMNDLGWGVYSFDHEDGIGQFEIDFNYADALTMADRYVFFRFMANSIARRHGAFATFMPKPLGDRAGSGAHFNMSLADTENGDNLFASPSDARGNKLSELG